MPFPDSVASGFVTGIIIPTRLGPGKKRARRVPVGWIEGFASRDGVGREIATGNPLTTISNDGTLKENSGYDGK